MIHLARYHTGPKATLGIMLTDEGMYYTLEPPWRENGRNISCIPAGDYRAVWRATSQFGLRYGLEDVPGRSGILIHPGNVAADTYGCILLGKRSGEIDGHPAVLNSRTALHEFESAMEGEDFELSIVNLWELA